jgi:hypothetical protein
MPGPDVGDDLLDPIIGRGIDDPALLWELISSVDAVHQTFIGIDDLQAGLARLAAAGRIRELAGHRYVDAHAGVGSAEMAPITASEWRAAVDEFQAEFERLNSDASEPYPRLTVAYATASGQAPTDIDIEGARMLRDRVIAVLATGGVTCMTGEVAAASTTVTFWVAGFEEADPDRMERLVGPMLAASAPDGSTLTIDMWDALAETELPTDFWVIGPDA